MLGCFFEDTAARGLSRRSLTICVAMWQPNWVLLISRPCQRSDLCLARALGLQSTRRWPIYLSHGRQRLTGGPDFVRRFAQFPTHNDATPTPRLRRLPLHFQRLAHCSRSGFFFWRRRLLSSMLVVCGESRCGSPAPQPASSGTCNGSIFL